jgi:DNA polymerase-1
MGILQKDKEKVVVIDAHALIHRAYHAMPNLFSKGGFPSGAIFGLTNILLGIIEDIKPSYIIASYDLPKQTFREMAYKEYKAHRKESDTNLVEQIKVSPKVFESFGISMVSKEGYEADDLIGTFVKKFSNRKEQIVIVTGDMDIMQMIEGDDVVVYTAKKTDSNIEQNLYNEEKVFEKYGIWPKQIPDYKGLRGDTSDNIPGIKGIGEKTAIEILKDGRKLEDVYRIVKDWEGNFAKQNFPQEKSKKIKYPFELSERMYELLKNGEEEAEFSKILATINCDVEYDFPKLVKYDFENYRQKVVDLCEEYNFKSIKNKLTGEKIEDKKSYNNDSPEDSFESFNIADRNIFTKEELDKSQIAIWLLNSEETNCEASRILFLTKKQNGKEALEYLEEEIKKQNLQNLYDLEISLLPILENMHENGIVLDRGKLQEILKRSEKEKEILVAEIYKLGGIEFNINSPKQMKEVLFEHLKIDAKQKKTAKGNVSVNAEVLEKMKDLHPIIPNILKYREVEKSINTYLEPLLMHSSFDGKIHTTFSIPSSSTGRLSSINPNMQNIPIRGEHGTELRSCFTSSEGLVLLGADYSQIELRVAAMLSGDEYLTKIFKEGGDVHTMIAMKMFNLENENEVTKDMRRAAKAMNFGIIYGMGVNSIKEDLQIDRKQAQDFYDKYTQSVWTLMKYLKGTVEKAKQTGYTETLFGRRTKIQSLFSAIPFIRAGGERLAMNATIQGTATGDIIKFALLDFAEEIKKNKWENIVRPILQIHDELLYEVKESEIEKVSKKLKETMENVMQKHKGEISKTYKDIWVDVPLLVNAVWSKNWSKT